MQYRPNKKGENISVLGYGCMRFSHKNGSIDLDKAEKEVMTAYEAGVNYYDTAYIYPGSEVALGAILEKNGIREKVNIATKLPQYLIHSKSAIDRYFNEQLSRLKTNYIDYYLMHMLTDIASWENMVSLGIVDWIAAKKETGAIKNIGFSFHGNTDMFLKILNAYDWDFCQIQYNYMDEVSQAGRDGLMAAAQKGIPVIIMEPLRGGKLINMLPDSAKSLISKNPRGYSAAEWGLRWLWDQPQVTCVLSGMNSIDQVKENIRIASDALPGHFNQDDFALISSIKQEINSKMKVGCTGCRYCMPCPKGVDIPATFKCYNDMYIEKKSSGRKEFYQTVGLRKEPALPTQCVSCGKCESHCPQHIAIRKELAAASKELLPWYYRIAVAVARRFVHR